MILVVDGNVVVVVVVVAAVVVDVVVGTVVGIIILCTRTELFACPIEFVAKQVYVPRSFKSKF